VIKLSERKNVLGAHFSEFLSTEKEVLISEGTSGFDAVVVSLLLSFQ